ncbi:MAG: NAD(P)-dependent oxidoreductase [Verrucomicrobiales bacterium]|nr:NAD(P)-dependent oxidoreductase [Verrucomicrobiales bacterium]
MSGISVAELDDEMATPGEAVIECLRNCSGDFAVLGAGGKMGFHLCLMLRKALDALGRDNKVRAVSRFGSVRDREEFGRIGCEVWPADLSDPAQLEKLPDSENIFYLAGVKFGTSHAPGLLQKMNVEMPQLVVERFRNSDFVALSTGCVYSFVSPDTGGATEADETNPPGDYANSCKGREQAFFDVATRYGTKSALIRLNYAIDLRYGVLIDIAEKVYAGEPVDVSTGYVNVIWQRDAIRHTIRSLEYVSAPPFLLNVTGPETLSVRELAEAFGGRFGKDALITGVEEPTAWLNNAARSHRLFGTPETGIGEMIYRVADWIEAGGDRLGKPTCFEIRDGNY